MRVGMLIYDEIQKSKYKYKYKYNTYKGKGLDPVGNQAVSEAML